MKTRKLGFTDEIDGELDREFTSNADGIKEGEYVGKSLAFSEGRDTTASIMRNSKIRTGADEYSNAEGYGILCGKKCVERKKAEGIPTKDAERAAKKDAKTGEKESENILNQALAQGLSATPVVPSQGMGTGAMVGIILGGLVLVGGLAYMMLRKK